MIARVRIDAAGRHTGIETSREEFHPYSFDGELLRALRCSVAEEEALAAAREAETGSG